MASGSHRPVLTRFGETHESRSLQAVIHAGTDGSMATRACANLQYALKLLCPQAGHPVYHCRPSCSNAEFQPEIA